MGASSPSNASSAALEMTGDGVGDSDIGAVEEFTLTPVRPKPFFFFNARGEYQFDSSIDNAGDFNVTRALAGIGTKFPLGGRFGASVGGVYDFAGYDFDDAVVFGGGEPWGDYQHRALHGRHQLHRQ
jgi:hypothetical protein